MNNILKNLFRKKNEWLEFDELAGAFTPGTSEQQKSKKGRGEDSLLVYESIGNVSLDSNLKLSTSRLDANATAPLQRTKRGIELNEVVIMGNRGGGSDHGMFSPGFSGFTQHPMAPIFNKATAFDREMDKILKSIKEKEMAKQAAAWKQLPTSFNIPETLHDIEKMIKTRGIHEPATNEPNHLRTEETPEALKNMDSGEFLNRYMKKIGLYDKVPSYKQNDYWFRSDFSKTFNNKLRKVGDGSFIPQPGDIYSQFIYNGIVKSYDKTTDTVTFFRYKPGHPLREAWKPGQVTIDSYKRADIALERTYYRPVKTHVANAEFATTSTHTKANAILNMVSCIDLSVSGAQAAAKIMEVSLPKFMNLTGRITPWGGIVDNLGQLAVEGFNKNDAAQLVAGAALIGFSTTLGAPVVFVGGLGLFIWELGETYVNMQKGQQ